MNKRSRLLTNKECREVLQELYRNAKERCTVEMEFEAIEVAQDTKSVKARDKEWAEPSDELLEIGRKAIENVLIKWRDGRLSEFTRSNGLVIREKGGGDSSIIRFGPETALRIGMEAMGRALKRSIDEH